MDLSCPKNLQDVKGENQRAEMEGQRWTQRVEIKRKWTLLSVIQ